MAKMILPMAAILALGAAGPVVANDSSENARQLIRYNTAELAQPEARRILMLRIERAARNLCGDPVIGSKEEADMIRACRTKATNMAVAQVPVAMASSD